MNVHHCHYVEFQLLQKQTQFKLEFQKPNFTKSFLMHVYVYVCLVSKVQAQVLPCT